MKIGDRVECQFFWKFACDVYGNISVAYIDYLCCGVIVNITGNSYVVKFDDEVISSVDKECLRLKERATIEFIE